MGSAAATTPTPAESTWRRAVPIATILLASAAAWTALFTLFPVAAQNFPLADDWAFALGAFTFAQGQGIHYFQWAAMPQLGQWVWTLPFIHLFGETHAALRIATITLSWLGLLAFYDLLRQERIRPGISAFAVAVLAFNPIFFMLQGTFMTDIPTLSFSLMALALYQRGFRTGSIRWHVAAALVAILGVLTRQTAIMVPVAAGLMLCRLPQRRTQLPWIAGVVLPILVGVLCHRWFEARLDVITAHPTFFPSPAAVLIAPFLVLHLSGLAITPLLPLVVRRESWTGTLVGTALMLITAAYWYRYGSLLPYEGLFPYVDGILTPVGAYSPYLFAGHRPVILTPLVRLFLTLAGCFGGGFLLARIAQVLVEAQWAHLLLLFSVLQIPLIIIAPYVFDRYLLLFVPGALYLVAVMIPRVQWAWLAAGACCTVFAIASICLMHDWLAWNVARWLLGDEAVASGVNPLNVQGGFEWDGWWRSVSTLPGFHPGTAPGNYILSFSATDDPASGKSSAKPFAIILNGTTRVNSRPYTQWLAPGKHEFFLLKAPEQSTGSAN